MLRPESKKSAVLQAYDEALLAGEKIRRQLDWLLQNGSAVGRVYAAILIRQFDNTAGRNALEAMKEDKTLLRYKKGAETMHYSVGEVAVDSLSKYPTIHFDCLSNSRAK